MLVLLRGGMRTSRIDIIELTVIKHAMASVNLRVELTDHVGEEDHGDSGGQEQASHPARESPKGSTVDGFSSHVVAEDDQDNHELTTEKVAIEVVTLVGEGGTHVGVLVGILVEVERNWCQTDDGSLASFHHGQPEGTDDEDNKGNSGVRFCGKSGLVREDRTHDEGSAEDEEETGVHVLNHQHGLVLLSIRVGHDC